MATGGSRRIQKGYEGQKYSVKRFAYDVLNITLAKCGFPETLLRVKVDKENDYSHSDYVITVHSAVLCIAFSMRDKWKQVFESKRRSAVLHDMQEVAKYLEKIEELPEFRLTDDLDKIRRSLAFYSELILFMHSYNIEVDFEKLLDVWSCYFNEEIAVNEDSDVLLEAIFIDDPDIEGYLSLVDVFISEYATPYGRIKYVSKKFKDFSEDVEKFYGQPRIRVGQLTPELLTSHSISTPHNPPDPPSKAVEKSVSSVSEIQRDLVLSGNRTSTEPIGQSYDFPLRSSRNKVRTVMFEGIKIIDEDTSQQSVVGESILTGHFKSHEPPREMATGGNWRIQKGYEGQKYSVKRFAFDVLYITLQKCGFPEPLLRARADRENDYSHSDYVITVHSAVLSIALSMRDKWKHMFKYIQKRSVLSDMQKVEKYLAEIEVLPEFRNTDDLDKIRRSLAFYSELMQFLHYDNIEVDFEELLVTWSRYFKEKIAVNEDSDVLLEALFIRDPDIDAYLHLVDCFLQEVAIPYGKKDVSEIFRIFSEQIEKFYAETEISVAEMLESLISSCLESTPHNLPDPLPKAVEESVPFFSAILEGNRASPEHPPALTSPSTSARGIENTFEGMNLCSDETTEESVGADTVLQDNRNPPVHPQDFPLHSSTEAKDRLEQMNLHSPETTPVSRDKKPKGEKLQ